MFKPRNLSYDKKEYSEYLRRQAEEQKKRKEYSKYMTEEEYRLNLNQLNVINFLFRELLMAVTPTKLISTDHSESLVITKS